MEGGWLRQEFTKDDMNYLVVAYGDKYICMYANSYDGDGNEQIKIALSDGDELVITHKKNGLRQKDWVYVVTANGASFTYASYQMIFDCMQLVIKMLNEHGITIVGKNAIITDGIPPEQLDDQVPLDMFFQL